MRLSRFLSPVSAVLGWLGANNRPRVYVDHGDADYDTVPDPVDERDFGPRTFVGNHEMRFCVRPVVGGWMAEVHDDAARLILADEGPYLFREVAWDVARNLLLDILPESDDPPPPAYDPRTDPDIVAWEKFYGQSYGRPSCPPTPEQMELCWARVARENRGARHV